MRLPKNRISVAKNTHIPRLAASCCCVRASNWSASAPRLSATLDVLLGDAVGVRLLRHHRRLLEIMRGRRRRSLPLQAFRPPRVGTGWRRIAHGPEEIDQGYDIPDAKDRSPGG